MCVSDSPVVRTRDLRKEYGDTVAVRDVSLSIERGEIFCLLGPNGAGKTTLVELLQGLRTPTGGEATVLGRSLKGGAAEIKQHIGVVPQSFHTFDRLTVRENVALVGDLHGADTAVEDVLETLSLTAYAEEPFQSLSGGYKRRTGIAMALVTDPELLFLDEPTTGLDPAARRATWEQIERLPDLGTTVVLTTHYMAEVEYLADRVGLLVDGGIEAVDTVPNLVDTYAGAVRLVVGPPTERSADRSDSLESTLEASATRVHRTDDGELIGVFNSRQRAQDAYGDLHDHGTGRSIDLVSPGMEDVFLEVAGTPLGPSGELR